MHKTAIATNSTIQVYSLLMDPGGVPTVGV